jgi:hypothetical protein
MQLQTHIPLETQKHNLIDYHSRILFIGSCFSENISKKCEYYKFKNSVNPFGILFQPLAIERLILNAINEKVFSENDVFYSNEQWHSFDAHSNLSAVSKMDVLDNLNTQIEFTIKQIRKASHCFISLGTAWVYRHVESDQIVANCHKVPNTNFIKELLTVNEVYESLQSIIALIRSVNNETSIIFTISPVRHLKDGFVENTQSKSHLISAVHQVIEPRNKVHYFPSYEIMMDELRDYRYYDQDMLHPSDTAIKYIWQKFVDTWVSSDSFPMMDQVEIIQKGLSHKPFKVDSEAHQQFLLHLKEKQQELQNQFPHIAF